MLDKNDPTQDKVQKQYEAYVTAKAVKTDVEEVLHDRGKFSGHADVTQKIKQVIYSHPNVKNLKPYHCEALDMITHNMGRIINGNPDSVGSWVDIAGYATLVANILEGKERC